MLLEGARPAYENPQDLTNGLLAEERAAVVLRDGYGPSYDQTVAILGSSPGTAREGPSAGERRPGRQERQ